MMVPVGRVFAKSCASLSDLADSSINCIITSPPYEDQRRYSSHCDDHGNFRGKEFIDRLRAPLSECLRVLRPDGSAFFNFHHGRAGGFASPTLHLFPALLEDVGFKIVQVQYWLKVNAQPSADPRLLKSSVEWIYHVATTTSYFANKDAVRAASLWAGRDNRARKYNPLGGDRGNWFCPALEQMSRLGIQDVLDALLGRDVDVLPLRKSQDQATIHPAKMPDELADWLVRYGSRPGDVVLDPWAGSGTSLCRAKALGRNWVGYELSHEFAKLAEKRLAQIAFGEALGQHAVASSPVRGKVATAASIAADAPLERPCRYCGVVFRVKKPWQLSCSNRCRYTHWNHADTRIRGGKQHGSQTDAGGGRRKGPSIAQDAVHLDEQAARPTPEGPGAGPFR